jgi:hypothetical protein
MAEFYNMKWYLKMALQENDNLKNKNKKISKNLYKEIQNFLGDV